MAKLRIKKIPKAKQGKEIILGTENFPAPLPEVIVRESTDPSARDFFNQITSIPFGSYRDNSMYNALVGQWASHGKPSISRPAKDDVRGSSWGNTRPNYSPFSNDIEVPALEGDWGDIPDYMIKDYLFDTYQSELAHSEQFKKQNIGNIIGGAIGDWIRNPYITEEGYNELYKMPGTVESTAHDEIEPALRKEFFKSLGAQYPYTGNYSDKLYRDNPNVPVTPYQYAAGGTVPKAVRYTPQEAVVRGILDMNQDKNFVQRVLTPGLGGSVPDPNDPTKRMTHFMESAGIDGGAMVYPRVVQQNGQLNFFEDYRDAQDYGLKNNEYIKFPDERSAQWFSENYKTPEFRATEYESGGRIAKDGDTVPGPIQQGYAFMKNYVDSPMYRQRLGKKMSVADADQTWGAAKANMRSYKVAPYVLPSDYAKPNDELIGSKITSPYLTTQYNKYWNTNIPSNTGIILDPVQARNYRGMDLAGNVYAHELGHQVRGLSDPEEFEIALKNKDQKAIGKRSAYNKLDYEIRQHRPFSSFLKGEYEGMHDSAPDENKADLDALRTEMYFNGIYDTSKRDMTMEDLQKALTHPKIKKSFTTDRLLKKFSKEDIIWMNNNIALQEQAASPTQGYAEYGGMIKAKYKAKNGESLLAQYAKNPVGASTQYPKADATRVAPTRAAPIMSEEERRAREIARGPQIRAAAPERGTAGQAWAAITNPVTAATTYYDKGYLPNNFEKGERNILDYATDIVNPARWVNDVGTSAYNMPSTFMEGVKSDGDFTNFALNALDVIPELPGSMGAIKRVTNSPFVGVAGGLAKQGDFWDLAKAGEFRAIANSPEMSKIKMAGTMSGLEKLSRFHNITPHVDDLYKNQAYKYANRSGGSSTLNEFGFFGGNGGGTTYKGSQNRDLLAQFIYGDKYGTQPGLKPIDAPNIGLAEYQTPGAPIRAYQMESDIPHGTIIPMDEVDFEGRMNTTLRGPQGEQINREVEPGIFATDVHQGYPTATVSPYDDVTGYQEYLNTNGPVPTLGSRDLWHITPKDYTKKWGRGLGGTTPEENYIKYLASKQSKMMHRAGTPFVLYQENPISIQNRYEPPVDQKKEYGGTISPQVRKYANGGTLKKGQEISLSQEEYDYLIQAGYELE